MAAVNSTPPVLTAKQIALFWAKVNRRGPDECWPWTRSINKTGYGSSGLRQRRCHSHVIARWLATGEWPAGFCTLHSCDNPRCCNPAHLWLGTHAENSADMVTKGRSHKPFRVGEAGHNVKLTEVEVLEIRRLHAAGGVTYVDLGNRYGVHSVTIRLIVKRINWLHLP